MVRGMKHISGTDICYAVKGFLLFCLFTFLPVSLLAQDDMPLRGCRRGIAMTTAHQRRAPQQELKPGGDYYHGDRRQLTVLVAFKDRAFKGDEAATKEQWDKIFNAENYHEAPFVGSVRDYFSAQSLQQLNLTFDLQYVALDEEHAKYRSTSSHDEYSQFLVQDVMAVLQTRAINWSLYDWNGDGYVNQLLIVFAGKGSSYGGFGGGYNAIWPHQYWLTWHVNPETQKNCESITVNYQDKPYIIDSYCAVQELAAEGGYGSFGTICHEFSHCFGFPDFYNDTSFLRYWDLMDYGNYGDDGFRPCNYSAHERWLMGWLTPTELTEAATVTKMPSLSDNTPQSAPTAYLIRNDGYADEYYIVENRQRTGWDLTLPGSGIVIFHIDYDPEVWITGYPNNSSQQRYIIIPANNVTSTSYSNNWPYPYQNGETLNDLLTNTSVPAATLLRENTDGTKLMSKPLTNMAVKNGLASFDFMGGSTGIRNIECETLNHEHSIYDLHGRRMAADWSSLPAGIYIQGKKKVVKK